VALAQMELILMGRILSRRSRCAASLNSIFLPAAQR
jgi:hypothetical protein